VASGGVHPRRGKPGGSPTRHTDLGTGLGPGSVGRIANPSLSAGRIGNPSYGGGTRPSIRGSEARGQLSPRTAAVRHLLLVRAKEERAADTGPPSGLTARDDFAGRFAATSFPWGARSWRSKCFVGRAAGMERGRMRRWRCACFFIYTIVHLCRPCGRPRPRYGGVSCRRGRSPQETLPVRAMLPRTGHAPDSNSLPPAAVILTYFLTIFHLMAKAVRGGVRTGIKRQAESCHTSVAEDTGTLFAILMYGGTCGSECPLTPPKKSGQNRTRSDSPRRGFNRPDGGQIHVPPALTPRPLLRGADQGRSRASCSPGANGPVRQASAGPSPYAFTNRCRVASKVTRPGFEPGQREPKSHGFAAQPLARQHFR
jgi:hypothetical protein